MSVRQGSSIIAGGIQIDNTPTSSSTNAVSSGGVYSALANKVSIGHEVIEFQAPTALNNYTWYRKYADGWVEQGGIFAVQGTGWKAAPTITLPVEMANNKYFVGFMGGYADYVDHDTVIVTRTTTTLSLSKYVSNSSEACWEVKGMAA